MVYVGVRDLKSKLSEYLAKAKSGDEIVVTEHGKPIARLIQEPKKQKSTIENMYLLVEKGQIELPSKDKRNQYTPPLKMKSTIRASELLLEDR